jgi:lipopolysaccharide export system permease protein
MAAVVGHLARQRRDGVGRGRDLLPVHPTIMKILDRYLIKNFLAPFLSCVLIFCVLVILGRFFDKMGIFTGYHAHVKDIVVFLLLGLPFWLNLVLPVATMLALLFSLGQLHQRGEFTAFRSAGIPSWRLYLPFAALGLLLALASLVGGMTFLPKLNFESRKVYRVHIKGRDVLEYQKDNIVAAGRDHRRFTIGWLDVPNHEMKNVVVDRFGDDLDWIDTYSAKLALYQDGRWLFKDGMWRYKDAADPSGLSEQPFSEKWLDIPEKPEDFAREDKETDDMTWRELLDQMDRLRRLGASTYKEQVAWNMRLALPFANIVVIVLAIPYALKSGAHGRAQNFSIALSLAFLYWGMTSICQSFGEQGRMPAWIAAWMSNFVFFAYASYRLLNQG